MEEPSLLDYLKSLLTPWRGAPIPLPPAEAPVSSQDAPEVEAYSGGDMFTEVAAAGPSSGPSPEKPVAWVEALAVEGAPPGAEALPAAQAISIPWRAPAALLLALVAQAAFAPPDRLYHEGLVWLCTAALMAGWAYLRGEWGLAPYPAGEKYRDALRVRTWPALAGGLLAAVAFLACGSGLFNSINLTLLGLSLFLLLWAFWQEGSSLLAWLQKRFERLFSSQWHITISRWSVVLLAAACLVLFFRFSQLDSVPPEMVSDHAEKYLDVNDILSGQARIFFSRNGGREALQFYLLAGLNHYLGLPQNHLTLKISMALVGLLALPFLYLAGLEAGNRRAALIAFTFAGIAYWPNVVARAGMRLPFYMLFTAATLYFLLRGIRSGRRNDFILCGLSLGLSAYGYSADRILPLAAAIAVGLYLLHRQSRGQRKQTLWQTILLALFAFVVFLPLLRYMILDPTGFSGRMISRLSGTEQPLPGPALEIFLDNLWRALKMFSVSNGVVWGVSIPDYPALGVVSGGLFYLGLFLVFIRYLHKRHWLDLFLLLSIPVLMLPSILSLAFPAENPSLYRTGGAFVPVFLLIGIALDGLMSGLETRLGKTWGAASAWLLAMLLLVISISQNYDLVFNKYYQQYRLSAWNYTEMGQAIRDFSETIGSPENAWLMGYPHWADTRLVAINAGYPQREYAMFIDQLATTTQTPGAKLFLVHIHDQEAIDALSQLYPDGWVQTYKSKAEHKDFLMFFVPPE